MCECGESEGVCVGAAKANNKGATLCVHVEGVEVAHGVEGVEGACLLPLSMTVLANFDDTV